MSFTFLNNLKQKLSLFRLSETKLVGGDRDDAVVKQLHRIRGQVTGVEKMYLDQRDCTEIVYQIMAIKNSLNQVAKKLLTSEIVACSREGDIEEIKKLMEQVVK